MKDSGTDSRQPDGTQEQKQGLSRRSFLAGTGGVAAAAAAATALAGPAAISSQGPPAARDLDPTRPRADRINTEPSIPAKIPAPSKTEFSCDVLVVGGGFAGLMAAVTAREAGQSVILVDKGKPGFSGLSPWVSSHRWFDPEMGDSADLVREQMMRGGQYIGNMNWLEVWLKESKGIFLKLRELGMFERYTRAGNFRFEHDENFTGYHESVARLDRHPRVMKILEEKGIEVRYHTMVTNVIEQGNRVVGAIGFHVPSGAISTFHAKAVVMAMGGGIYKPAGWPSSGISHDGIAIGYRLGLPIIGQEFDDFHSTASNEPSNAFYANGWTYVENIWFCGGDWTKKSVRESQAPTVALQKINAARLGTEAWDGTAFANNINVARSLSGRPDDLRIGKQSSTNPKGDCYGCGAGFGMHLTNGIFCGLDDTVGDTGIPGLYVAGDGTSGSAIAGAQYVGGRGFTSNFVSVQGRRAGEAAAKYARFVSHERIEAGAIESEIERILAPMKLKRGFSANWALDGLQGIMAPAWTIIIKHADRLNAALTQIAYMRDHVVPKLQAVSSHDLRFCHEMRHKVLQAEMKLRANLARQESRGDHFREDFPFRDDKFLCYFGLKKGGDGQMTLNRIEIKDEWKGNLKEEFATRYGNVLYPGEAEALHLKVAETPKSSG
jgi:succinate dehydrogenase/fumarate reductase flavoprotein subunit